MSRDSDREEGEISDDENEIILRIQEYESTNRELEQIAQINNYSPYKRVKRRDLISDLSSISSDEFTTPYIQNKRRRRTIKAKKKTKKQCQFRHTSTSKNRSEENIHHVAEFVNRQQSVQFYERITDECDSNSRNSIKVCDISDDSDRYSRSGANREELRLALTHNYTTSEVNKVTLKERLQKERNVTVASDVGTKLHGNIADLKELEKDENFEDDVEENELRMIALKSAIIRKHLARKKRNAELAYSPTDFDATLASANNTEDNEIEEIPIHSMDTSPLSSPSSNMSLSMSASFVDNKTVDMDIASSESDIEMIIYDNQKSNNFDLNIVDSFNTKQHHYERLYQSNQGLENLPSSESKFENIVPPPPPYTDFKVYGCENNFPSINFHNIHMNETPLTHSLNADNILLDVEDSLNEGKCIDHNQSSLNGMDSDFENNVEEEEALRALLLSKRSTSIVKRNNVNNQTIHLLSHVTDENKAQHVHSDASSTHLADTEILLKYQNPEIILKKAVLRLNNISTVNPDIESTRCNEELQVSTFDTDIDNKVLNNKGQSQINTIKTENNNSYLHIAEEGDNESIKATPIKVKMKTVQNIHRTKENDKLIEGNNEITRSETRSIKLIKSTNDDSRNCSLSNASKPTELLHSAKKDTYKNTLFENNNILSNGVTRSKSVDEIKNLNESGKMLTRIDCNSSPVLLNKLDSTSTCTSMSNTAKQLLMKLPTSSPVSPAPVSVKTSSVPTNNSRLITSANLPDFKVKKLVIQVNVSDSEDDVIHSTSTVVNTTSELSNTNLEHRIDTFLKNMRLNANNASKNSIPCTEQNPVKFMTPQAVKHLPKAAQEEYLRLVNRMNLLQQKKQVKKPETVDINVNQLECVNNNELIISSSDATKENVSEQSESTLKGYEHLLRKISIRIISHLDKSLQLVEEAKKIKIEKLRSEQRLKKLRKELEQAQQRFRVEQQKMQKLSPAITVANDQITTLKQKRLRLLKFANSLGKSVRGTEYRSTNEFKHDISLKSKKLASCIKVVNSIKFKNLDEFVVARTPICSGEENVLSQMPLQEIECDLKVQQTCTDVINEVDNLCITTTSVENENEKSCPNDICDIKDAQLPCAQTQALQEYISPLSQCKSKLNLNGIVCPYELMGECRDNDCIYVHLDSTKQLLP